MNKVTTGVVIPSHREGFGIVQALAGISRAAKHVAHGVNTKVCVVINASSSAPQDTYQINAQTMKLMQKIQSGEIPDGLCTQGRNFVQDNLQEFFPSAYMSEMVAARDIIENQGDHIEFIPILENPRQCNVGIARNAGVHELLRRYPYLQKIVMLDGDSQVTRHHIGIASNTNKLNPLHGPRISLCPTEMREVIIRINRNYYITDIFRTFREAAYLCNRSVYEENSFVISGVGLAEASRPGMINMSGTPEGAHMIFTPQVFQKSGGFPEIASGEDTKFAQRVEQAGDNWVSDDNLPVATIERFSNRTTNGQGAANIVLNCPLHQKKILPYGFVGIPTYKLITTLAQQNGRKIRLQAFKQLVTPIYPDLCKLSPEQWQRFHQSCLQEGRIHIDPEATSFPMLYVLETSAIGIRFPDAMEQFDQAHTNTLQQIGLGDVWQSFRQEVQGLPDYRK